ncbi:uncharacterized protein PRCAT00002304001 [Priceomyces carsonii]|uniref:uncharacterized protein n=1 Tax=Priceomyces carsonii TaxID=28549 RepID=UPI002EDBB3D1|nr:unnamed protein product [Priceomyces carsonii]
MSNILSLILCSVVMAFGTFGAGILPLKLNLSSNKRKLVSMFSMGILAGTAMMMVIPEGFEISLSKNKALETSSSYLGLPLLTGFMLMYIIDHVSVLLSTSSWKLASDERTADETDAVKDVFLSLLRSPLTFGLSLHAIVDGISLGTSFLKKESTFGLIFFMTIVLHKLPTSFSLAAILLKEGISNKIIKIHVLLFSLMTPISSISSYIILQIFTSNDDSTVGALFLFSGGTFLYAVIHVMMEVLNSENSIVPLSSESDETWNPETGVNTKELISSFCGMLVPTLLSLVSEHDK